jgi:hypothetical protein
MRYLRPIAPFLVLGLATRAGAQENGGLTLDVRGFADFNYAATQRPGPSGFRDGQVAGHLIAGLTEKLTFFTEVSLTGRNDGAALEAERAFLRYDQADWLKLSVGRFHTPTSYWNTAYHHGQWLQTTAGKPEMVNGQRYFLPMHFVGAMAEGSHPVGPLELGYALGVGNGRSTNINRSGDGGDVNGSRATVAATTLRLPRVTGIQAGASIYHDRVTPDGTTDASERTVTGYVTRVTTNSEILVEYARIDHQSLLVAAATRTQSRAYYVQLARALPGAASAFKPYTRFERVRVPSADVVFAPLKLNYDGRIVGLRYDVAPMAALKLEYRGERIEGSRRMRTIAAQLSFTFPGPGMGGHDHEPTVAGEPEDAGSEHGGEHSGEHTGRGGAEHGEHGQNGTGGR